jgi:hypothetical protein
MKRRRVQERRRAEATGAACIALATALALALAATAAWAKAPEDQVARLGKDLTPVGAERAGNADGTIPEWTGGVTAPPPGWKPGDPRVDPFKDDAKLFSIDASNVDQYADKLAPGQIELIKRYQDFRLDVYPTRRSCAFPDWIYEKTRHNARVAHLDEDNIYLEEGWNGVLFPIPNNGAEVIWNHTTTFFGRGKIEYNAIIVPTKSGAIVPVKERAIYDAHIHDPNLSSLKEAKGRMCSFLLETLSPPRVAGELILVHEMANEPRRAWIYNPGQRRVRRAPTVAYDNPVAGAESLITNDQGRMFNGMLDRFDWKLLGKKEMYILYNNFRINNDRSLKYTEFMGAQYPRRDIFRYELHRVWVVEATVKEGKRHLFSKRVFYLDEDSWGANHEDIYDRRGGLWRIMEGGPKLIAKLPTCIQDGTFSYDLAAGRYVADRIKTQEPEADWLAGQEGRIDPNIFKPDSLRRMGRR